MAQTAGKESLDSVPTPPAEATVPAPEVMKPAAKPSFAGPRLSYGLNAGTSISNMGSASYLEPSVRYQVTNRFRGFASFSYMAVMPQSYKTTTPEGGTIMRRTGASSHYIVSAGGEYLLSDRLILSGRVWKDLSQAPGQNPMYNRYNGFMNPGRQGADFRATYKITEHLSVTGGVRYTDGASPFYNPYGPGYGNSPFGY